ncbi:hypothetical protein [Haliangium ochraceum]|uniref:Cytochrome c domain-containing protein n=1 Tax=Haliangium ochraceum (strain DSM 14365 / JCM 11303 / SMP-2) TaxID=502025 RepID=D0LJK3_HALO1|nr:hypothetical protein [Haliangium ochraceum]ACY16577.1 hypothetical protein Hoch_4079 [Haliangium ochraceum DSM 14365]
MTPSLSLRRTLSAAALTGAAFTAALLVTGCEVEDLGGVDAGMQDTFTQLYETETFQKCAGCHAPGAPGFQDGTETTQDWSTRDAAFQSLQGTASGLIGNFEACNGVSLLGTAPENSLLLAAFDEDVRLDFSTSEAAGCDGDAISDMTAVVGELSANELSLLRTFVMEQTTATTTAAFAP